jgi:hypothetical protein
LLLQNVVEENRLLYREQMANTITRIENALNENINEKMDIMARSNLLLTACDLILGDESENRGKIYRE